MGEQQAVGAADLRAVLGAARDGLAGVGDALATLSGQDLAELMAAADEVAARARAAQVQVTAEAAHRGEFASARRGAGSVHAWVREHAPSLRQGGAGQVAQLAQDVASSTPGGLWSRGGPEAGAYADDGRPEGIVWGRVLTGEVGVGLALTALREVARMRDLLVPEAVPTVTRAILDHGVRRGQAEARRIRPWLVAAYGLEGEFDDQQRRLRGGAFLSSPVVAEGDLTEYRMAMTPDQAARLEAAIGPLSKPCPDPETGAADMPGAGQRRVEALASVLGRVASVEGAAAAPGAASTALHVSMGLAELLAGLAGVAGIGRSGSGGGGGSASAGPGGSGLSGDGGGCVMGSRAAGTLLAPSVVRQLACDADLIPVVLGADGEVVDLGRATRLYTRAQRRALWHRDGGCTYPGCTAPAAWTQAHHLVHWVDGGPSDLVNAALLCQRHHTLVHDRRLIAAVHPPDEHGRSVTWDLDIGSYDRELKGRLRELRHARGAPGRGDGRRVRLDTGPLDGWASVLPEPVLLRLADDLEAEALAEAVLSCPDSKAA
ncbi:hypothetical protein GCM10022415_20230 [Knoellia locipacati]|uniref:HNH nuclease domain-containing protein n=1 Tax=Knoellia locipacati TaxID=882824 RepID=A0A512T1C7_9MICO|nr:HNH endonuclease signature motif containing protein [Knoellia locipacati]GEQ13971.1 hypothetical protein KLO01_20180 [Knoellia locipacati]